MESVDVPNHVNKNPRSLAQSGARPPPVAKHMSIHEDILLNKYLEKFNIHDDFVVGRGGGRARLEIDSPYLQKLTHSNFLHTIVNGSGGNHHNNNNNNNHSIITRPSSSTNRPPSAAGNSKQPPTKSDSLNQLKRGAGGESGGRASSAPMRRRSESEQSLLRNPNNNNNGGKKRRNLFQRMPHLIRAVAFRNGSRDVSAYITAKSLIEVSS